MAQEYNYTHVPILYYDALSSQARSCHMLIKMLKINVELRPTDAINDVNFCDTYTWINSFCLLPTLVDGNVILSNGHSILIYLCEKYAPLNLANVCPSDYISRMRLMSLLFYEGCILFRRLNQLLADIFLAKYPNFDTDYHKRKVSTVFKTLNTFLKAQTFMVGNRLTIADISCVSTVSALNIIFPIDYEKYQNLFDWFQRIKKMDFYIYNEEGIHKLRYLLNKLGKFPFPLPLYKSDGHGYRESDEKNNNASDSIIKPHRHEATKLKTVDSRNVKQIYKADKISSSDSFEYLMNPELFNLSNKKSSECVCACIQLGTNKYFNSNHSPIKKDGFNENNEMHRRTEGNNINMEQENGTYSTANNYTICRCRYSPNSAYRAKEFDEVVECDYSIQTLPTVNNPVIGIKSCVYVQYNGTNIDHQDCRYFCSRRKEGHTEDKQIPCSCFFNKELYRASKTKTITKRSKNNKKSDFENSKINEKDNEKVENADFEEDAKQQSVKCDETRIINKPFMKKFNPNQEFEIIRQKDNTIEITESSIGTPIKQSKKRKSITSANNGFTNLKVQNLLEKVRSLENILENSTSEMIKKKMNLPKFNKNAKVSEDSSFGSLKDGELSHNSLVIDMCNNNQNSGFTYQDVEHLLSKVRSLENILKNDKVMANKSNQTHLPNVKNKLDRNPILNTNVSDDFLAESLTQEGENFINDSKLTDKVRMSKSSQTKLSRFNNKSYKNPVLDTTTSAESLTEEEENNFAHTSSSPKGNNTKEDILDLEKSLLKEDNLNNDSLNSSIDTVSISRHILIPNFIVTNSESELQNPITSNVKETPNKYSETHSSGRYCCNCNTNLIKHKRLEAGSNPKRQESLSYEDDLPMTSAQFKQRDVRAEDNVSHNSEIITKVIYHICMKNTSKYRNNCHCDDCLKKEQIKLNKKSKIPRLISNFKRKTK